MQLQQTIREGNFFFPKYNISFSLSNVDTISKSDAIGKIPLFAISQLSPWKLTTEPKYRIKRYPAGIYLLKVNHRNTRVRCEILS